MSTKQPARSRLAATAIVDPRADLGEGATVEDYCLVGLPANGREPALRIGPGATIRSHSVLHAGSQIGARFQCEKGCLVRENCQIGDEVQLGAHVVIEAQVRIGQRVQVAASATLLTGIRLGDGCRVAAGAVVTEDVPAGATVEGNPARLVNLVREPNIQPLRRAS
jgi:UDP-3-O-[3-hydroxymyristoyl] glucosamine N-acyltransferase